MTPRTCPVCGKTFDPRAPRQKYCSKACKRRHDYRKYKELNRRYAREHREYFREYARRWRRLRGAGMDSYGSAKVRDEYARRAVAALDGGTRETLALLLSGWYGYSKTELLRWCRQPNLYGVLKEIERLEEE